MGIRQSISKWYFLQEISQKVLRANGFERHKPVRNISQPIFIYRLCRIYRSKRRKKRFRTIFLPILLRNVSQDRTLFK